MTDFGVKKPTLLFTPYSWSKAMYLANKGDTEIGAFGVSKKDNPLLVIDLYMIKQTCSSGHVDFDKDDIGRFFDDMVDKGYRPSEFGRIWIHTHPGSSPNPSGTDENTFSEVFGKHNWSIMGILCRAGEYYVRLQYMEPRSSLELKAKVDYTADFNGSNKVEWDTEYNTYLQKQTIHSVYNSRHYNPNTFEHYRDTMYRDGTLINRQSEMFGMDERFANVKPEKKIRHEDRKFLQEEKVIIENLEGVDDECWDWDSNESKYAEDYTDPTTDDYKNTILAQLDLLNKEGEIE